MRRKKIPIYLGIGIVFIAITLFLFLVNFVFYLTRSEYISKQNSLYNQLEEKLGPIYTFFQNNFGIDLNQNIQWKETINFVTENEVMTSVSPFLSMINSFIGMAIMTLIYTLILLAGTYKYREYVERLGGKKTVRIY